MPVDKKNSQDQIWGRGRKHKILNSEDTVFITPILFFRLLNDRQDNFHKLWKLWEISLKEIEENHWQSQTIMESR